MIQRHAFGGAPRRLPPALALLALALVVGFAALGLLAFGRGAPAPTAPPAPASAFNGGVVDPPGALPALALARADGGAFHLAEARGRLSLVFFGYTTCPDVCPLTLATMNEARQSLGADADAVDAYFVTVDPGRDTPERLRQYLGHFQPAVVGLTGTDAQLEQSRAAFGVVAQRRAAPDGGQDYSMDHTAAVFVLDREARLRLLFPAGLTAEEMAADLRHLLAEPGAPRAAEQPHAVAAPAGRAAAGTLTVEGAWARAGKHGGTSAVYLTIRNAGEAEDVLTGVETPLAAMAEVHQSRDEGGVMTMHPAGDLAVPGHGALTLRPGGTHVMLMGLGDDLHPGDDLALTLHFKRAGAVQLRVPVRAADGGKAH